MGASCLPCAEKEAEVTRCARALARAHDLGQRQTVVQKWSAQLAQAKADLQRSREMCDHDYPARSAEARRRLS